MKFSGFIFAAQDRQTQEDRYRFILDTARYLDRNGYEAMWTPERHFQEFGGSFPNPAVLSAALATITSRLSLRAGSIVAPHHHPVRIAEDWALVDQLSQGRTGLCFAAGWHKRDFVFYPNNHEHRKSVTFETIETVQRLWRGERCHFDAGGESIDVGTFPRPYRQDIPVWLVFSSDPNIWTIAGEKGYGVLTLLNDWTQLEAGIEAYKRARDAAGLDPEGGMVTAALHTFVGEDDASVKALVEAPLKRYLQSFVGARIDNQRLSGGQAPMTQEERDIILTSAFDDLFANRSLLGDLDKCSHVVERLAALGVGEVAALIDFGLDFPAVSSALERLTALKDRFEGEVPGRPEMAPTPVQQPARSRYYERF